jgi:hypothetical protein
MNRKEYVDYREEELEDELAETSERELASVLNFDELDRILHQCNNMLSVFLSFNEPGNGAEAVVQK